MLGVPFPAVPEIAVANGSICVGVGLLIRDIPAVSVEFVGDGTPESISGVLLRLSGWEYMSGHCCTSAAGVASPAAGS